MQWKIFKALFMKLHYVYMLWSNGKLSILLFTYFVDIARMFNRNMPIYKLLF